MEIIYGINDSPFGKILIAKIDKGITDLLFIKNAEIAEKKLFSRWGKATFARQDMSEAVNKIFYNNEKPDINLIGTDFQVKVWQALLTIPKGTTCSYNDIAEKIRHPKAVRAVANAIGQNPICYLVPCHRVIRKDGSLGGFSAGIKIKKAILSTELRRIE